MKKPIVYSAVVTASLVSLCLAQSQQPIRQGQNVNNQANQAQYQNQNRAQQNQNQQMQQEQQTPQQLQKCIAGFSADNQFEIQAGQFVSQRAQDQQVKQLAMKLAQDHQQAEQQLQQVARQAGVQITQQLNPVKQAMLQELEQMQGRELERHFVFSTVGGHEKDILMTQWEAEHSRSPQVKQYAQQQLPVLQEHLTMARQIAEQWVPQARTAGERVPGQMPQNQQGITNPNNPNNPNNTGRTNPGR